MKLFDSLNNQHLISIAKIHMQELKEIGCKFMRERVNGTVRNVTESFADSVEGNGHLHHLLNR